MIGNNSRMYGHGDPLFMATLQWVVNGVDCETKSKVQLATMDENRHVTGHGDPLFQAAHQASHHHKKKKHLVDVLFWMRFRQRISSKKRKEGHPLTQEAEEHDEANRQEDPLVQEIRHWFEDAPQQQLLRTSPPPHNSWATLDRQGHGDPLMEACMEYSASQSQHRGQYKVHGDDLLKECIRAA